MPKSLTLKQLEKDKEQITQMMQQAETQASQLQLASYGFRRILDYINDNIRALKEDEDDR
jgi:ABC-type transporter Mla subunit MlaD